MKKGTGPKLSAGSLIRKIKSLSDPVIASHAQRFFKTGKGEYADGEQFLGIRVTVLRKLARDFREMPLGETITLLKAEEHEIRLCALFLLTHRFKISDPAGREKIFRVYLKHSRFINNWDLVDSSAPQILGGHLEGKGTGNLFRLARSKNLWERRMAVLATFHFIRGGRYEEILKLAALLLTDPEDLIHKAVGWMLRELGNRDPRLEREFLKKHHREMPRTMLRYAIEKFPEAERKRYLKGNV